MKKVFLIVLLLFQISLLFAEKEYQSSDGYFLYYFSDDFTEFKYTTLDDYGIFSNIKKIQKKVSNGITIISRKSGQKIPKIANLQYYKSKANYGTKKKGISR